MKKKIILLTVVATSLLASCKTSIHYEYRDYVKEVEWKNDDFKVLTLGDIHFSQTDDLVKHMKFMDLTISEANADMIVLNGDAFTYADKYTVDQLFSFIDSYNTPWTFVFGNHDDQGYYADNYIQRLLGNNDVYKNVKFVNLEFDDVSGRSNFVLNLVKNDTLKYQLYFFDSHSYDYARYEYDYIKEDQIAWYERMVESTNKEINPNWKVGDEAIKSSAFMHIPLPEYRDAMEDLENTLVSDEYGRKLGTTEEKCSAPSINTGLYTSFVNYKSTQSVTASHDHVNDLVMFDGNMYLTYGVHATDRIYCDLKHLGGQLMTIQDDSTLKFRNIYHAYSQVK